MTTVVLVSGSVTHPHFRVFCCCALPQGDITLKLFPEECPRTVENFTTHAKNGYYDNVIFHRVIKGFMLQTGDPLGKPGAGRGVLRVGGWGA